MAKNSSGGARIGRLATKELRETLRDRRTIITLIAMPLLVYPILSLIFRTFLFSSMGALPSDEPIQYSIVVSSNLQNGQIVGIRDLVYFTTKNIFDPESKDEGENESQSNADEQTPGGLEQANSESAGTELSSDSSPDSDEESAAEDMSVNGVVGFRKHDWTIIEPKEDQIATLREGIRNGDIDIGLLIRSRTKNLFDGVEMKMISNPDLPRSRNAAEYLKARFDAFNQIRLRQRLQAAGKRSQLPFGMEEENVEMESGAQKPVSLAAIIPLMLVLMTITGAVYPAIDLTAGERERGTLETLVAAPIPRISILFSKFIAVLTVAILTATLNVIGILVTVWAFRLETILAGPAGLTWPMIFKIFSLLILFASFFSAVLLAVTSYARSFKEAQAYLIPIILLSLAPGLMALTPGLTIDGPLSVAPMVNILLLARDVLQGSVATVPALIAIVTTILYGCVAILVAAKIFGTDAILYGSQGNWKDLFTRPNEESEVVAGTTVAACLALLFPINFVLIGFLGRFEGALQNRLLLMGFFTFLTFMAFPWIVASFQRVRLSSGFGFRMPKIGFFAIGILLGVSLWPMVMSIITGWQHVLELFMGDAQTQEWHDRLIEFGKAQALELRTISPVIIAITFSIIPAVCEEWFFRGFLQRSLLKHRSPFLAIVISAAVFGVFHVLSNSVVAMDRLLPTTLVGLVLGYLCYRSGSILPGIILHMIHNAIVAFLAYYQPQLSQLDWFPAEGDAIPGSWIAVSAVVSLLCLVGLHLTRGKDAEAEPVLDSEV